MKSIIGRTPLPLRDERDKNRRRLVAATGIVSGGTFLGQLLLFLSYPVLTRLYSPQEFGVFGAFVALVSLLEVNSSLRYDSAIPVPQEDDRALQLTSLSLRVLSFYTALSWVGLAVAGSGLFRSLDAGAASRFWWLAPLAIFAMGGSRIFFFWLVRHKTFSVVARARVYGALGQVVPAVGLGLASVGPLGLILGYISGVIFTARSIARPNFRRIWIACRRGGSTGLTRIAREYSTFPTLGVGAVAAARAADEVPALLLAALCGNQVLGWFVLATRVIRTPLRTVGDAISMVYYGEAAELARDNPKELLPLTMWVAGRVFLIAGIPSALLAWVAPWLLTWILGNPWTETGYYVRYLCIVIPIELAISPLHKLFASLQALHWELAAGTLRFLVNCLGIVIPLATGGGARNAILGFALANALGWIISLVVLRCALLRRSNP